MCIIFFKCRLTSRILDNISNGVSLIVGGVVKLPKAAACFSYERCAGGSEFCNHFCQVTLGKPNGGYCDGPSDCCCKDWEIYVWRWLYFFNMIVQVHLQA